MGIQKKIFFGFVIIGFILFISGFICVIQLVKVEDSVKGLLADNMLSIDIGSKLSEETERLSWEVSQVVIDHNPTYQSSFNDQLYQDLISAAQKNITAKGEEQVLDSLRLAYDSFKMSTLKIDSIYSNANANYKYWYANLYKPSLMRLLYAIKQLRLVNHAAIAENTQHLESNFYRMIMPPIIAIAVGLFLIILFNYFINLYFINPLLAISSGIKKYLQYRIPYNIKIQTQDEIDDLNEDVKQLISQAKKLDKL